MDPQWRSTTDSSTCLTNVAVGNVHLLSSLTISRHNLSDDCAISGEDDEEWNEISENRIDPVPVADPVPGIDEGLPELWTYPAVRRSASRLDDVSGEEEVHVDAEEQDGHDGPDDDYASTGTQLFAAERQPDRYQTF